MVLMATKGGRCPWPTVMRMPIPNLVALCKQIMVSEYREQYEWAWANFVSSQCSQKNLKEMTDPWKKIARIKG